MNKRPITATTTAIVVPLFDMNFNHYIPCQPWAAVDYAVLKWDHKTGGFVSHSVHGSLEDAKKAARKYHEDVARTYCITE